jgi:hypothetical protein
VRELVVIETGGETPLMRLLDALGVVFKKASLENALSPPGAGEVGGGVLVITEEQLAKAHEVARARSTTLPRLFSNFGRALVFPLQGTLAGAQALSEWAGTEVEIKHLEPGDGPYSVAPLGTCGPFAGLQLCPANPANDFGLAFSNPPFPVEPLIRVAELGLFTRISLPGTDLFVAGASSVFDVEAELMGNIRAAECFSSLVPLILFLRYSQVACWWSPHHPANVVIDDPYLRHSYGFLNLKQLARCVDELRCAVSIGFIPWNFRRTSPEIVELFRSRWPSISLSIHGCDHTGSEFSTRTASRAQQQISLALERMRQLSSRTGLRHDKVMVFPQGEFSAAAMQALRHSQLLGVVNTELMDRQTGSGVRAEELLKPAITSYAGFPLFLRRRGEEPIANFALDVLLGKPCLVVTHHDYYQRGMEPLVSLVRALNSLDPALGWTNLESLVSNSICVRANPDQTTDVRLFSSSTQLPQLGPCGETRFSKVEPLVDGSSRVLVNREPQACTLVDGGLTFRRPPEAAQPLTIEVKLRSPDPVPPTAQPLKHRAKVAVRRYFSEFRDNYVAKSAWATAALTSTRSLIRKPRSHLALNHWKNLEG